MVRPDQETSHSDPTAAIDDHAAERPDDQLGTAPERIGRLLIFAAVAGLLAGLASEFICERIMNSYHTDLNPPVQQNPNPEDVTRNERSPRLLGYSDIHGVGGTFWDCRGACGWNGGAFSCRQLLGSYIGTYARIGRRRFVIAGSGVVLLQVFDRQPPVRRTIAPSVHPQCNLVGGRRSWRRGVWAGDWGPGPLEGDFGRRCRRCGRGCGHL